MLEIGRVCIKLAGREATKYCVVVDKVDNNFVLIDGQVKRKRCNIAHLEPTNHIIKIKKGATHAEVAKELEKLKIKIIKTKPRTKKAEKSKKQRKKKEKPTNEIKQVKKEPQKTKQVKGVKAEKTKKKK